MADEKMTDEQTVEPLVERLSPYAYAVDGGADAYGEMEADPLGDYVTYEALTYALDEIDRLRDALRYYADIGEVARAALKGSGK